jgi:hypothetical protein
MSRYGEDVAKLNLPRSCSLVKLEWGRPAPRGTASPATDEAALTEACSSEPAIGDHRTEATL